jgi:regulator of PEP synthase PpsR (kinase-PPPase family)
LTPLFWSQISGNLKTKIASEIEMQITELIHHLIASVQQTINSEPTRKHDGTSRISTIPNYGFVDPVENKVACKLV